MLRALFLAPYPHEAASTRFRATQYFPFLEENGVSCQLASLLSSRDFKTFYAPGGRLGKAARLVASAVKQSLRALSSSRFDVVFVQRGALLFGPPVLEWLIATANRTPVVFDIDDAIWLQDPVSAWGRLARLSKFPSKVAQIIRMSRHVIACNAYARDYALTLRTPDEITVIPTVVDAEVFQPTNHSNSNLPVVGWIGTHSTSRYLDEIIDPLRQAAEQHKFILKIVGSGRDWNVPGADVVAKAWSLPDEVADYQSLDIGLYPVRADEWGKGKSGFKPVVYMSCGAVCIASPVGGVTEFVRDGENGVLATSAEDWSDALVRLLADQRLRRRLGSAARQTILDFYCLRVQAPRLLQVLQQAAAG